MNHDDNAQKEKTMKMNTTWAVMLVMLVAMTFIGADTDGCSKSRPVSSSGVGKVSVKVKPGPDGLTTEQRNIRDRLDRDAESGSIKHLYIISAYSGQVLIYSTVRGKVTSSGKRLTPTSVIGDTQSRSSYFDIEIGGRDYATTEVLQDDGTYGSSVEYLYWFDTKGVYHQHYVTGGQIPHISTEPLAVKSVVINMELTAPQGAPSSMGDPSTTMATPTTIAVPKK